MSLFFYNTVECSCFFEKPLYENQINFCLLTGMTPVTSRLTITHSGFTQYENRTKRVLVILQSYRVAYG